MMTVQLRGAQPGQLRISLAAVRVGFLLMLLGLFGSVAFGQGLIAGGPLVFGPVNLGNSSTGILIFSVPPSGSVDIGSINVTTEGVTNTDFTLSTTQTTCNLGTITYPGSCKIYVTFTPTQIGTRLGALTVTDSGGTIVNTVYLSGTGVSPQFVFAPARAITTSTATALNPADFTVGAAVQDSTGDLFFTDGPNKRILERTSTGSFSQVALPVVPTGITMDGAGTLYVSSASSIYTIPYGFHAASPIVISGATLMAASGLAVDLSGDLYIADSVSNQIYQVPLGSDTYMANTLALAAPGAPLSGPTGLAVYPTYDANGNLSTNLYIADSGHNRVVEVSVGPNTTSVVKLTSLTPSDPTGVAVDAAGTLYIANTGDSNVIEATVENDQFILADPALTLSSPSSVVIDTAGNLVIGDSALGLVYVPRSKPFIDFPTPTVVGELDAIDDPETLTVQGTGNIASTLNAGADPSFTGTNPTAFLNANTGTCPMLTGGSAAFSIGEVCNYTLNFQPTVVGPNLANLVLTTTAAGGLTSTSSARLYGIGLNQLNHFTLVASSVPATTPTTVNLNGTVQLVLTAIDANGAVATDYTGLITFTTSDSNGVYKGGSSPGLTTTTYTMTAANNGVLTIPVPSGLQLNQYGIFTATAVADPASVPPGANGTAVSNDIYVVEADTLTLTSSVNPSLPGQQTIFTLTVGTAGTVTPGGTVTFYSDGVQIGSVQQLVNDTASVPDTFANPGNYNITATYVSTTNTQGGTAMLTQVVGQLPTIVLTSSINPSVVNQTTTLSAVVTATPTPTGTVTFYSNGVAIGTANLSGGVATLPTSFPAAGLYTLTAIYNGSSTDQKATSAPLTQTVLNLATIALTSSVNPIFLDNATVLTATVTSTGPAPTGAITFFDGTTPIGSGMIVNGTVSVSASFVYAGTHLLTASYAGNSVTGAGVSPALLETVADFTLTVASGGSSTGSTLAGGTATYALAVTPVITAAFPSAISLTVTGVPSGDTGALTPVSIAAGSGATPVTLAVTAAQIVAALHTQQPPAHRPRERYAPVALALMALPLAWFRRRKRFGAFFASVCLLLAITGGLTGCSGPTTGYYGQTPQTYNLTVTATSGNLVRSTYLTLTVE